MPLKKLPPQLYRNMLPIGFAIVILMMVASSFFTVIQMKERSEQRIRSVKQQNINSELLGMMSQAVLNRTTILVEMLQTDDPFRNDELFLELTSLATQFAVARAKFESQDLSPRLQKLLDTQGQLIKINEPLLNNIYELIQNDKREKAQSIFKNITLPRLKINQNIIQDMSDNQFWISNDSLIESKHKSDEDFIWIVLVNLASVLTSILLTFYLIRRQKLSDKTLAYQASTDILTELPNRSNFLDNINKQIKTNPSSTFAIIFFDIDYFKSINDNYGHEVGDKILKLFSSKINSYTKKADVLARFGGDEFVLLLRSIHTEKEATNFINNLSLNLDTSFYIDNEEIFITASIGASLYSKICHCNYICNTAESLLKHADIAMYSAKQSGRNCYRFFSKEASDKMERDHTICHALHSIIKSNNEKNELFLKYQPLMKIDDGEVEECEALIRWTNSNGEKIPADEFIPLAEKTNLIEKINLFVINEACKQQRDWRQTGIKDIRININLSGNKAIFNKALDLLQKNIEKMALSPKLFGIELTERTLNEISQDTINKLNINRKLGMKISIDDFGTEYSSLSYLKKLPITTLKIDKGFISGLPDDKDDRAFVKTIIMLGHSLNLDIVAEGVETYEQLEFLKEHSCNIAQGYYFHKPLKSEQISQLKLVA